MNKELKKTIKQAFEAPIPTGKEQFLKDLKYPKRTYQSFLASQIFYIRKRVWIISFLVVVCETVLLSIHPNTNWSNALWRDWAFSAFIPFFALVIVTEIYRSGAYQMGELESTLRFDLKEIIIARLIILGGISFVVFSFLIIMCMQILVSKVLFVLVYIMVPYFVVCGLSLLILNKRSNVEGIYGCAAVSCLVSLIGTMPALYQDIYLMGWIIVFISSIVLIIGQLRKLVRRTEEQTWNLLFGK